MQSFLSPFDLFGHPVLLKSKGRSMNYYSTCLGGFVSLAIRAGFLYYVYLLITRVGKEFRTETVSKLIKENEELPFGKNGEMIYFLLTDNEGKQLELDTALKTFFEV